MAWQDMAYAQETTCRVQRLPGLDVKLDRIQSLKHEMENVLESWGMRPCGLVLLCGKW